MAVGEVDLGGVPGHRFGIALEECLDAAVSAVEERVGLVMSSLAAVEGGEGGRYAGIVGPGQDRLVDHGRLAGFSLELENLRQPLFGRQVAGQAASGFLEEGGGASVGTDLFLVRSPLHVQPGNRHRVDGRDEAFGLGVELGGPLLVA